VSVETVDRSMLGKTTYRASGYRNTDDMVDLREVDAREYKTLSAAKLAARSWITKGAREFAIYRGTYESDEFNDEVHGRVLDAVWRQDDDVMWLGWIDGDGIDWEEQ
jgi:hypothetical protein